MKKAIPSVELAKIPPEQADYTFFQEGEHHPFRPEISEFDLCNAWWLAEYSFLSYKDPPQIMKTIGNLGLEAPRCFETGRAFCFALPMEKDLIIAFRGTRSSNVRVIQDIITNIQHTLVPAEANGHVHRGFHDSFLSIWEEGGLGSYIKTYRESHPKDRVWFTGHSLGGALATMASVRTKTNCTLYTYGSPMVGNSRYVKLVPKRAFRIVHNNDAVPHLPPPFPPPESREMEYCHAGTLRYIDRKGKIKTKVTHRGNRLTALLKQTSRITSTLSDSKSSLLYRIYSLGKREWQEQVPASEMGEELDRIAALLADYMDASVPDHAPIFYTTHLWKNLPARR